MKKITATLIASLFAGAAFAQTPPPAPAAPAPAPMAAPAASAATPAPEAKHADKHVTKAHAKKVKPAKAPVEKDGAPVPPAPPAPPAPVK